MSDSDETRHPDPLLNRWLLLEERSAALERGRKIVEHRVAQATGFSQVLGCRSSKGIAMLLVESETAALLAESERLTIDAAQALGIDLPSGKNFDGGDLERLLAFYEWKMISTKQPTDAFWNGRTPWRDAAGFGS